MFHQVNDDKNQWNNKSICITKENFQYFINKLIESGYSFKSISELNKDSSPNNVFITFDDIFLDAYLNAITYLNEKKIPYCVFITTDYVDKEPYISKSILKELSENPLCTIGAHTKSHPILRFLNESEARKEISKDHLEDLIKKKIDYFAYPYGSNYAVSKSNIKIVQEASYKMAFSTYSMGIDKIYFEKNKFFIPRININNKTYLGWCD
jgi:peptidoglycan/xylan/chitin deacetylase (PgdA/CDA1 family)